MKLILECNIDIREVISVGSVIIDNINLTIIDNDATISQHFH